MDLSQLTQEDVINRAVLNKNALVRKNSDLRPALQIRVPIDLTTARDASTPLKIDGPFDGFYVENSGTTDSATLAKISFSSPEQNNLANYTTIGQNDSAEFKEPIREIYITNTAQSGKTLVLILYLGVDFKPGSTVNTVSGGVVIITGTGLTPNAVIQANNVAAQLFPASAARKKVTIQVLTGAGIYLSGVNTVVGATGAIVGSLVGIFVGLGGTFEWQNSGACWVITDGGNSLVSINTET